MIMDKQLLAADAQAVTITAVSANAVDLGSARDVSRGQPIRAIATVVTAFAGGTSVRADLIQSANADLSTPDTLATGATITTANATLGAKLADYPIPSNTKRYIGFNFVVVGTMTAGKVTAGLVLDTDSGGQFAAYTGF